MSGRGQGPKSRPCLSSHASSSYPWEIPGLLLPLTWDQTPPPPHTPLPSFPPFPPTDETCPPSRRPIWPRHAGCLSHFSRLRGQTAPRHANNSQIIQEVVKGAPTQTEATPDPRTGQKSGSSFPFLICHQAALNTALWMRPFIESPFLSCRKLLYFFFYCNLNLTFFKWR